LRNIKKSPIPFIDKETLLRSNDLLLYANHYFFLIFPLKPEGVGGVEEKNW